MCSWRNGGGGEGFSFVTGDGDPILESFPPALNGLGGLPGMEFAVGDPWGTPGDFASLVLSSWILWLL